MKFFTFLLFAAFTIGAEAVKGSPRQSRFLKNDVVDGEGNCIDQDAAFYTPATDDCEICSRCNKEIPIATGVSFKYTSAGMDSRYQGPDYATCVAGTYPSTATVTAAGQTFQVSEGTEFELLVPGNKFDANTVFTISGFGDCIIHLSCSAPIVAGDQIGPFEILRNGNCDPLEELCLKTDKKTYDCGDPIVIDFDITDETDDLGQTGALPNDWIGIYPCDVPFGSSSFFFPIINKYVCDQFVGDDSSVCSIDSVSYPSGTLTIDKLPLYGDLGPYIWPVTAFRDNGAVQNSFKAVIMRDDGPSVPPFIPVCESECFTIVPDETTQQCETRDIAIQFNTAAPTGGFVACFPGDATVEVAGKGKVSMKDISLGDKVLTGNNKHEAIYSFGHRNEAARMEFVKLVTAGKSLELSKDHLVYANGQPVPASIVKVGDQLQLADGSLAGVRAIKSVIKTGVYAPFTNSGSIIVNGIKASTFIAFQESGTAHVAGIDTGITFQFLAQLSEFPQQVWCTHFSACDTETYTTEGISMRVSGLHTMFVWLFAQNFAVVATTVVAVAVACTSVRARSTKKVE